MTDRRMFSKEARDKPRPEKDEEASDYYYDDSTGYRVYDGEEDGDEDDEDKADEVAR